MSDGTSIPYLDATWNPISMRCTPCSPGCDHCWARAVQRRFHREHRGEPVLVESVLQQPLHWTRKPRRIGVQFNGDIFHPSIPREMIAAVLDVVVACPQHTFLFLTKRAAEVYWKVPTSYIYPRWPRNAWVGLSLCTEEEAVRRWPKFAQAVYDIRPAVVWLSLEPLLTSISVEPMLTDDRTPVKWVVAGCESGPGRRQSKTRWFRQLRHECIEHGVPYMYKQGEEHGTVVELPELDGFLWDQMPDMVTA